ncbi:MAG TPA: DUF3047 domain-containing protein [Allosphingosinicella sp.]|jgi:hypothetical protein|nr:DUF3047 domain-containing protein [Allosphingosinicella sp.]
MILKLLLAAAAVAAAPVWVGRFSGQGAPPAPWRVVRVNKQARPTIYSLATIGGVGAVEARADNAMALLARPLAVDLAVTPILCWRWRIDAPVARADMRTRAGDDYAARVYVAFDMPDSALSLAARMRLALGRRLFGSAIPDAALNYVWDNRNAVGVHRRSAYTDRVEMIVAETGATRAGEWVSERADVGADFARAFGGRGRPIQLAIASDTDNTGSRARAAFADLHFVARTERCAA